MSQSRQAGRRSARERAELTFADAVVAGALARVRDELFALSRLLREQPQLRKTLADIAVPPGAKQGLLRDLLAGQLDPNTLSLVEDLAAEDAISYRLRQVLEDLGVQAILAEADARGALGDVADELFRFARTVDGSAELRSALTNPYLDDDRKRAVVADLLEGATSETGLLAAWAVTRPDDPGEVLRALADRAAARRHRVIVEARTAVPLDDDRRDRLAAALAAATGSDVDIEVLVDPAVVGGVVARVGDEVIDGSIRRKLELAMERLTA
ncbi:MAG TPA: F0F1 ATP synthase subunit delta [Actinomycetota bacterium]|nr:F0F1 ATP synthase subunit delta [Actinomycetota bacterium]